MHSHRAQIYGLTGAEYKDKSKTSKVTIQSTFTQIMTASKELFPAGFAESWGHGSRAKWALLSPIWRQRKKTQVIKTVTGPQLNTTLRNTCRVPAPVSQSKLKKGRFGAKRQGLNKSACPRSEFLGLCNIGHFDRQMNAFWGLWIQTTQISIQTWPLSSCVTSCESLNLPVPLFSYLQNGDICTYLT